MTETDRMTAVRNQLREVQEAIDAADYAVQCLNSAYAELKSAGNWGIVDMLGGGFFTTMIKRGHMDEAKRKMAIARNALRSFSSEMADVQEKGYYMDTDGLITFFDYMSDSFLVDWYVQSKINNAKGQVEDALNKVIGLRALLKNQRDDLQAELDEQ